MPTSLHTAQTHTNLKAKSMAGAGEHIRAQPAELGSPELPASLGSAEILSSWAKCSLHIPYSDSGTANLKGLIFI